MRAVGGTCVDYSDVRIGDGVHRFARGGVGQTEDGDVAGVDGFGTALRILAFRGGKREQSDVGPVMQPFVDLQPSGALVAVDENKGKVHAGNTPVTESDKWSEPLSSAQR